MILIILFLMIVPSVSFSAQNSFAQNVDYLRTVKIEQAYIEKVDQYEKLYKFEKSQPQFCPFNSTGEESLEKTLALLAKGFDGDCLGESNEFSKKIINESMQLQTQINVNPDMNLNSYLNQDRIKTIFDGLDASLSFESCSDEKKRSMLNRSSSVLRSMAQLGLYSASTTTSSASYGLLIASSALKFIDNLLSRGFSFNNKEDIKTFKKLNCSYYDIRHKLQSINFYKRPTLKMEEDYKKVNDLIKEIDTKYSENIQKIQTQIDEEVEKSALSFVKLLNAKEESLNKIIPLLPENLTKRVHALSILDFLIVNFHSIKNAVESDFLVPVIPLRDISYADAHFLGLLKKIDLSLQTQIADKLSQMTTEDFSKEFYTPFRDHLIRLSLKLKAKKAKKKLFFLENGTLSVEGINYNIASLKAINKSKGLDKLKDDRQKLISKLQTTNDYLYSIVRRKVQSREDGFDNGDENIIKLNRKLNDHIYGKLGDDFVDAINNQATKTFKEYSEKAENVSEEYFNNTYLKTIVDTSDESIHNFCVSSQELLELAALGSIQIEMAHDFFATNDYLIRKSKGRVVMPGPREDLYENSQSALKAVKIRKKIRKYYPSLLDEIDEETTREIEEMQSSWWQDFTVGENMIKATTSEREMLWIEKVRSNLNCPEQFLKRYKD